MPYENDDPDFAVVMLKEAGNALADALDNLDPGPGKAVTRDWHKLVRRDDTSDEFITALIDHGKRLKQFALDWLEDPLLEGPDRERLDEAVDLWSTVQCPPDELPGG